MKLLLAGLVVCLAACSENPKKIAEVWVKTQLKDPFSARFLHRNTMKTGQRRWIQCGTVNAKNSLGAYVGYTAYVVFIKQGAVHKGHIDRDSDWAAIICGIKSTRNKAL